LKGKAANNGVYIVMSIAFKPDSWWHYVNILQKRIKTFVYTTCSSI